MLEQFGQGIWISNGTNVEVMGFHYPTRMAIIKLPDGSLFIWSPIGLTDRLKAEVDGLGKVRHIIAPNSLHHLSIPDWQSAYPDANVYAPPNLRDKRKDISFDADLGDTPNPDWSDQIDQAIMYGNRITTEVVFFHIESGTVLFTDLIQHFPDTWFSGWRRVIAKLDLMIAPEPSVPRKFRMAFTNRRSARASIARIYAWPARQVLMAHGSPVTKDATAFLRRAFSWLSK